MVQFKIPTVVASNAARNCFKVSLKMSRGFLFTNVETLWFLVKSDAVVSHLEW